MEKKEIIESISIRGNGCIYLGVVGAVRTGKSTFIKKMIENLVVPNIKNENDKKICMDEIPQSSTGKTIMTTEPKFVPSNGANIKIDEFETNIKLIDCVGYVVDASNGYQDELGNPRLVKTPWYEEEIPFVEAAEIGTEKVIKDHSTIGIVVTTDGSIGTLGRNDYIEAEEKVITELKSINKPFIVILNSTHPNSDATKNIRNELGSNYNVPVISMDIENMNEVDMINILRTALYEFPVTDVSINIPEWIHVLDNKHDIKNHYITKIKECITNVEKIKDVDNIIDYFKDSEYINEAYISNVDTSTGIVTLNLNSNDELYNETLKNIMGDVNLSKANMIKIFSDYSNNKDETESIKNAIKMAKSTGYGIVYPTLKDMKLDTPQVIKQGNRYGVKLKAVASSIHLLKVDVESSFEPIIGTELQSKQLIDYLMKDKDRDPQAIWKSEIFGRSIDNIVKEGIQAKLSLTPENARYKLQQTLSKLVNKGSGNLFAIVI